MELNIKRIDTYDDNRFSKQALLQHGAFIVNDRYAYEFEVISQHSAIVKGEDRYMREVIDEFRFYAQHITRFYDQSGQCMVTFDDVVVFDVPILDIQPSQFYVNRTKMKAVSSFIDKEEDPVIPLIRYHGRYASLDGHTRLAVAIEKGMKRVKGFLTETDDYIYGFIEEAIRRGITSPYEMKIVSEEEYEVKWNQFCDAYFKNRAMEKQSG